MQPNGYRAVLLHRPAGESRLVRRPNYNRNLANTRAALQATIGVLVTYAHRQGAEVMNEVRSRRVELCRIAQWLAIGLLLGSPASSRSRDVSAPADRFATLVEINGPIGPALSQYVETRSRMPTTSTVL